MVDAWPKALAAHDYRARYARLGHVDGAERRPAFVLAGNLNKEIMAHENHRFLALRKPRALRRSRALLLPVGPWFDDWGELIGRTALLDDGDRAEVVGALIELHLSSPRQQGCLRALAGIHRTTRGGLASYVVDLPARLRKEALRGRIREALDVSPEHFEARTEKRLRASGGSHQPRDRRRGGGAGGGPRAARAGGAASGPWDNPAPLPCGPENDASRALTG